MLCVSQASTAICLSMDEASSSSSSTAQLGGRAIDRHNPIICDGRRSTATSSPIINPKLQKTKKVSVLNNDQKRKSGGTNSQAKMAEFFRTDHYYVIGSKKKSSKKGGGDEFLVTPPGSSRYLLGDSTDGVSAEYYNRIDPGLALVPLGNKKSQVAKRDSSSSSSSALQSKPPPSNQVVVLRVSLHCKGCEGKVRKHLSRMEGVTSFNIDFAAKKVTVVGDVTPVSVLASISKVKNAQIWSSSVSSVSPSTQAANKN